MNLFVYGTLLADAVVKSVLGKHVETLPAVLTGYKRLRLKNRVYPGILKADASLEISGKILLNLTPTDIAILDDYENEYERVLEEVTQEDGTKRKTFLYVWASGVDETLEEDWDYEKWYNSAFSKGDFMTDLL